MPPWWAASTLSGSSNTSSNRSSTWRPVITKRGAAAELQRVGGRGPVEGRRDGGPPVDDHGVVPLVLDVAPADVPGVAVLGVEAAEGQARDLGVEAAVPVAQVGLGDGRVDLVRGRIGDVGPPVSPALAWRPGGRRPDRGRPAHRSRSGWVGEGLAGMSGPPDAACAPRRKKAGVRGVVRGTARGPAAARHSGRRCGRAGVVASSCGRGAHVRRQNARAVMRRGGRCDLAASGERCRQAGGGGDAVDPEADATRASSSWPGMPAPGCRAGRPTPRARSRRGRRNVGDRGACTRRPSP